MHRFYIAQPIDADTIIITDPAMLLQMRKVLRLKAGEHCVMFDGSTREFECEILSLGSERAELLVVKARACAAELKRSITLYQALLKGDHFELVVQKAAEIGVKKIVPIVTERTIVRELSDAKRARYEHILVEATEQCGGCVVPKLDAVMGLKEALKKSGKGVLFFYEGEQEKGVRKKEIGNTVSIFVGPEGGFTDAEVASARSSGAEVTSLGPRILRAETAAIVACALAASA